MLSEGSYPQDKSEEQLWRRYCGFIDLSINEFMEIQKKLLMEEIERVADSVLGKKIMGNRKPQSVEEFRRIVPLTNYEDYEPYLSERQEDALAQKPYLWCHSAARGGYFKWVPYTSEFIDTAIDRMLSGIILASARQKGRANIGPGFRFLCILPPAPYSSGSVFQNFPKRFTFRPIPPLETSKDMEFEERIQKGFQLALRDGVDVIGAIASVLVKMGEAFSGETRSMKVSPSMVHPKILLRLLKAWYRSKMERRALLPKDIWPAKAIMAGGVDTIIYRDNIAHYWGSAPYEFYGCTETYLLAVQSWGSRSLVFFPDLAFLEFIPYEEQPTYQDVKEYQPTTILLDELEEGKSYEVVITQLYGMPLLRYRIRDLIKVTAVGNEETGVNLPHIAFQRRIDDVINLGSMAWLDEKTIWQAIANTGIKYADWSACKEYEQNQSFLRLYLELKEEREIAELEAMIDEQLKMVNPDYKDVESYLGIKPVRVTLVSEGTFGRYIEEKRKEGADLAHMKPAHINPSDTVIQRLLQLSRVTN